MNTNDPDSLDQNYVDLNDITCTIVGASPNGVWMVSDGQGMNPPPSVTPTISPTGNLFSIELDAGRQDSTPVADKFNALCGGANNVVCTTTNIGNTPGQLNFFFGVDLSLKQGGVPSTVTVYLGQGSNDWGANNWWIGGDCISSEGVLSAWFGPDLITLPFTGNSTNQFLFSQLLNGPTLRTNDVTFTDNSKTIVGVAPTGTYMVSAGQPMNTPATVTQNITPSSNGFTIELDAGRSDTGPVAASFNSLCGGAANEWGIGTVTDSSPGTLNFYFGVEIKLQVGTDTSTVIVYLGQGTSGPDNNWWIGGECISDSGQLTATVGGQTVTLNLSSSGSNGFIFSTVSNSSSQNTEGEKS
ncbi:MAG TPA: hypothetical protein VFI24_21765 [Pyrinomonadaceae bacterium]|nr:hypothetical protein [Pyrinomonadaceae bacterium]